MNVLISEAGSRIENLIIRIGGWRIAEHVIIR